MTNLQKILSLAGIVLAVGASATLSLAAPMADTLRNA